MYLIAAITQRLLLLKGCDLFQNMLAVRITDFEEINKELAYLGVFGIVILQDRRGAQKLRPVPNTIIIERYPAICSGEINQIFALEEVLQIRQRRTNLTASVCS